MCTFLGQVRLRARDAPCQTRHNLQSHLSRWDLQSVLFAGVVVTLGWGRAVAAEQLVAQANMSPELRTACPVTPSQAASPLLEVTS